MLNIKNLNIEFYAKIQFTGTEVLEPVWYHVRIGVSYTRSLGVHRMAVNFLFLFNPSINSFEIN